MGLDHSNNFRSKYNFREIDVNETVTYKGDARTIRNIRTACGNWGTRYGIWLSAHKNLVGDLEVTRKEGPLSKHTVRNLTINERLKRLEDGLRFASILLIKIKEKLEDNE